MSKYIREELIDRRKPDEVIKKARTMQIAIQHKLIKEIGAERKVRIDAKIAQYPDIEERRERLEKLDQIALYGTMDTEEYKNYLEFKAQYEKDATDIKVFIDNLIDYYEMLIKNEFRKLVQRQIVTIDEFIKTKEEKYEFIMNLSNEEADLHISKELKDLEKSEYLTILFSDPMYQVISDDKEFDNKKSEIEEILSAMEEVLKEDIINKTDEFDNDFTNLDLKISELKEIRPSVDITEYEKRKEILRSSNNVKQEIGILEESPIVTDENIEQINGNIDSISDEYRGREFKELLRNRLNAIEVTKIEEEPEEEEAITETKAPKKAEKGDGFFSRLLTKIGHVVLKVTLVNKILQSRFVRNICERCYNFANSHDMKRTAKFFANRVKNTVGPNTIKTYVSDERLKTLKYKLQKDKFRSEKSKQKCESKFDDIRKKYSASHRKYYSRLKDINFTEFSKVTADALKEKYFEFLDNTDDIANDEHILYDLSNLNTNTLTNEITKTKIKLKRR